MSENKNYVEELGQKAEETLKNMQELHAKYQTQYELDMADIKAGKLETTELVEKFEGMNKTIDQVLSRVDTIEATKSMGINMGDSKEAVEASAKSILKSLVGKHSSEDTKHLKSIGFSTLSEQDLGFAVRVDALSDIIKNIVEVSPMEQVARIVRTNNKSKAVLRRLSVEEGAYVPEGTLIEVSETEKYVKEELVLVKNVKRTLHTIEADMFVEGRDIDSGEALDMLSIIVENAMEGMMRQRNRAYVSGTGVNEPFGFINDPDIIASTTTSSAAGTFDLDDVIVLSGLTPDAGNAATPTNIAEAYFMSKATRTFMRLQKDGQDQYLWGIDISAAPRETFNGFPVILMPDLARPTNIRTGTYATGVVPVAFGDMRRAYMIIQRNGITIRNTDNKLEEGLIETFFMEWHHGKIVNPEAIKTLTIQ